jgi:O-antigen/teichoic acid export membrane protein
LVEGITCWAAPNFRSTLRPVVGALLRWSPRLTASVADQALFSGAHFLCHLVLARTATPGEYGAFSLAYAGFLFAAGVHSALILEPMGVIGPLDYAGRESVYLRAVLGLHWAASAALGGLMLGAAAVLAACGSPAWPSMAAAALGAPAILLLWLVRRAAYMATRPAQAVAVSALYALGLGVGLWLVHRIFGRVAGPVALAWMGAVALAVCWPTLRSWNAREKSLPAGNRLPWREPAARQHWEYGRWSLLRAVLVWAASAAYLPVVGALGGLQAAGMYRAAENLTLPMAQILTVLGILWAPWMAAQRRKQGSGYLARAAAKAALAAGLLAAGYGFVLLAAGWKLSQWVYGSEEYASALRLLPFLTLALVLRAVADTGIGTALRASGRPDLLVWPAAMSALTTMTLGVWLASRFPLVGAAAGLAASAAVGAVATAATFRSCAARESFR